MGTFNAVPQSAVMRSNSWWRGVSSLRFGMGGRRVATARRGVSAASGMDGRGRVAGVSLGPRRSTRRARRRAGAGAYASSARRRGLRGASRGVAPFHDGTLVSYSSNERSVDMRSSSSSGRGQDMFCSLRALAQLSLSGAAPARLRLRWPRLRYRRGWARVTTFEEPGRNPALSKSSFFA